MANYELIMNKLEEQGKKLDKIESLVVEVAVQANKITNLQDQVDALFLKHDEMFKAEGLISTLISTKTQIKSVVTQVKIIWVAIVGTAITIISKTFGGV